MKTYNGNNISKKQIYSVLRSLDRTAIYRLCHQIYNDVSRHVVYKFILDFAPSKKVVNAAYKIAYESPNVLRKIKFDSDTINYTIDYNRKNAKHLALEMLRYNMSNDLGAYTKKPLLGYAHLYFASPIYEHRDYNKIQTYVTIKGNEKFCNTIVSIGDKYLTGNY